MKKFIKGALETVVEDNDRRIPEYISNGWEEVKPNQPKEDEADKRRKKAIDDANASEEKKGKKGKKKNAAPDKKVNDAINANAAAASESEEVDDGLLKKEGE